MARGKIAARHILRRSIAAQLLGGRFRYSLFFSAREGEGESEAGGAGGSVFN